MAEKIKCSVCGKAFEAEESLQMHFRAKHSEPEKKKHGFSLGKAKKIRNYIVVIALILLIGSLGILYLAANANVLPPTDIQGHTETVPKSHVLKEPMPIAMQKHMLEHADGSGLPGVIINYNCIDYACEAGLIEKLEAFASKYDFVYVAPFPNMSAKIVLTRDGKISVLAGYDEEKIGQFIVKG